MLFCLIGITVYGQPAPPGGGGDPHAVPIDGFLSFLIVAGSLLGIKKFRSKNK